MIKVSRGLKELVDREGRDKDWICIRGRVYEIIRIGDKLLTTKHLFKKYLGTSSTFAVIDGKVCTIKWHAPRSNPSGLIVVEVVKCGEEVEQDFED